MPKTKIELEYPYNKDWKYGYLNTNSEERKTLALYNSNNDRSSTQYARYLLSVYLKRYLTDEECVDHIDGDKTNNDINNLQILSRKENNVKSNKQPDVNFTCPICKQDFSKTLTQLRGRKEKIKNQTLCCSKECGYKQTSLTLKNRN